MNATRRFSVDPSLPIDSWGSVFTVAPFTDERYLPFTRRQKEISRITQYWRLLWGMQDARETFSVGGSLSLIVLYFRIFANPFWTLVCASKRRAVLASIDLANMCGPWRIAASILSVDHYGPQLTGHPSVDNDCRRWFSLWWVVYVRGHMSPILLILSLIFRTSGIVILLLIACFNEMFRCWDVWS